MVKSERQSNDFHFWRPDSFCFELINIVELYLSLLVYKDSTASQVSLVSQWEKYSLNFDCSEILKEISFRHNQKLLKNLVFGDS